MNNINYKIHDQNHKIWSSCIKYSQDNVTARTWQITNNKLFDPVFNAICGIRNLIIVLQQN